MDNFKRCLVLSPHYDDAELGCGATISRMTHHKVKVLVAVFAQQRRVSENTKSLLSEIGGSSKLLGFRTEIENFESRRLNEQRQEVLDWMIGLNNDFKPDIVIGPSLIQTHQDHEIVAHEAFRAFKYTSLLGYDMPWNNLDSGRLTTFVEVTEEDVKLKTLALNCYKSQMPRPYFEENMVRALARSRGLQCGKELAEAFETYRWFL